MVFLWKRTEGSAWIKMAEAPGSIATGMGGDEVVPATRIYRHEYLNLVRTGRFWVRGMPSLTRPHFFCARSEFTLRMEKRSPAQRHKLLHSVGLWEQLLGGPETLLLQGAREQKPPQARTRRC